MKNLVHLTVPALFALHVSFASAQENPRQVASPDKKFVYEFVEPDGDTAFGKTRVASKVTGDTVWESPEEMNNSWVQTAKCVWSPDSKRFALNYRAGGRYETADVFRWDGKAFVPSPSFEELFSSRLEAAKQKELRDLADKLPDFPDKKAILHRSQRRIWDNFTVRRWIDNNTLEATGYSIRFVTPGVEENDGEDISGALRLVLRSDTRGRWKILEEQNIPLDEAQTDNP